MTTYRPPEPAAPWDPQPDDDNIRSLVIPDLPARRVLHRGDSFTIKDPDFLWPNWITRNAFNLITGDPGAGKSSVIADLVARMTADHATWPDGEPIKAPCQVALINLEDPADQMILPRVAAAGGRVNRVWVAPEGIINYDDAGLAWLEREMNQHDITVVLSDQMSMGFDPRASMYDYAAMYREGARVNHWCRRNNRTAIMAHHHRKGKGETMLERVGGTNGLAAVARSVLQVYVPARKLDDPFRYLGVTKPNPDAEIPGTMPFTTARCQIPDRDRFVWNIDWQAQLQQPLEELFGSHMAKEEEAPRKGAIVPEIHEHIMEQMRDEKARGLSSKIVVGVEYRRKLQNKFACSEKTVDRALSNLTGVLRHSVPGTGLILELQGEP